MSLDYDLADYDNLDPSHRGCRDGCGVCPRCDSEAAADLEADVLDD